MYPLPESACDKTADFIALGSCRGKEWIITSGNRALADLLHIPHERLLGQSLPALMATGSPEPGFAGIEKFSGNSPVVLHCQDFLYVLAWRFIDDPALEDRGFALHEIPAHSLNQGEDISERELNTLVDSIHDGIWVIDSRGITLRVNKALENMTGIPAKALVGKHVSAPMREGRYFACVTLRALEEKKPVTMFDDYDNGKRFLNTSVPVFDDMGRVWRVIACIRDMSILEDMQHKLLDLELANMSYKNRIKELEQTEFVNFAGTSQPFRRMMREIAKAARVSACTMISGETGTGKTFAAQAIHSSSPRRDEPFIVVNCGAIPATLIESELFGYEKGAFTGAQRAGKIGLFESAGKGTILLDEIAEFPLPMQVKLLHVLDGGAVTRVGGITPRRIEARVIAATNRSLDAMVKAGEFREDLYYRLNILTVHIPALRERIGDIPALAHYFLAQANQKNGMDKILKPDVVDYFSCYSWPGNVRELRATIEYLVAMTERRVIRLRDLPERIRSAMDESSLTKSENMSLAAALANVERRLLEKALMEAGNTRGAAKKLQISQSSVVRKAHRHKIGLTEVVHS